MQRLLLSAFLALGVVPICWCAPHPADDCDLGECASADGSIDVAPPGCDLAAEPKDSTLCIDDRVGTFVSVLGNDGTGDGTKVRPYRSLTRAIAVGNRSRVYICAGTYPGSVSVDGSKALTGIYGGFACETWTYTGERSKLVASAEGVAVRLATGTGGFTLADLDITATDSVTAGGSSIGLLANQTTASLVRLRLSAGNGGKGSDGSVAPYTFPSLDALKGKAAPDGNTGGPETSYQCPGATSQTLGGKGGNIGFSGEPGGPAPAGGKAGTLAMCSESSTGGGNGSAGAPGQTGGGASTLGTLRADGWTPTAGQAGADGAPGGGGGGGGGAGGSGGGGGAGGCGGARGGPGTGGGGTIALASVDSQLTIRDSELLSRNAGAGGSGKSGQAGQPTGGARGAGNGGCGGGAGGAGGNGGAGGGGAGGLSAGIVYRGGRPTRDAATRITLGAAGSKGAGGASGSNDGVNGEAREELQSP